VRRVLLTLAALAIVVYVCVPREAHVLPPAPSQIGEPVRGVFHVHTRRSDGSGTVEQVARAAARAGLRFVVVTDHGDGTRARSAPAYHNGVLVIDAVEVSTNHGHVVALNADRSPYPLAGEARDVAEDIRRMGGVAIAAHPGSRKPQLRWTDWGVPVDGLEHMNGDSEWRDEPAWRLARAIFAYPVRPVETLGLLFDRSDDVLRQWDALTTTRRVVAIAGADAHGRLGLRAQEPYQGWLALPIPGYESVFRSASIALPQARLSRDAENDAKAVIDEIRAGRVFSSVDALAAQPRFHFAATSGRFQAAGGEVLTLDGPVRIEVTAQAPPDVEIVLLRNGARLATSTGASLHHDGEPVPAVYRVEVNLRGAPGEPPVPGSCQIRFTSPARQRNRSRYHALPRRRGAISTPTDRRRSGPSSTALRRRAPSMSCRPSPGRSCCFGMRFRAVRLRIRSRPSSQRRVRCLPATIG
jgi:hypothetical protein